MVSKLQYAWTIATEKLAKFIVDTNFENQIHLAFGNDIEISSAKELIQNLIAEKDIPTIEILPANKINGANGAFAGENNTIYLAQEYLEKSNSEDVSALLLEELGHYLDWKLNAKDSPGDEGAIFSALARGKSLSDIQLQQLKAEDDTVAVSWNGQNFQLEQQTITVSGTIQWEYEKEPYPVRQSIVKIYDKNDNLLTTDDITTDEQGKYEVTLDDKNGSIKKEDIYIEVFAKSDNNNILRYETKRNGLQGYSIKTKETSNPLDLLIKNKTNGNDTKDELAAFSIGDAIYTAGLADIALTSSIPENNLPIMYPRGSTSYVVADKALIVSSDRSFNWDVLHHEYGHFLGDRLNLIPALPNGTRGHVPGESNINKKVEIGGVEVRRSKLDGIKIAWTEGLANYFSSAIQRVAKENEFLPSISNVDDLKYSSTDTIGKDFNFSIENSSGQPSELGVNKGEGDEGPIGRILWDIADEKNEEHDQVALGHEQLLSELIAIASNENNDNNLVDSLDEVWDYFF